MSNVEQQGRTPEQQVILRDGIYKFIEKYGPVTKQEVLVGGKRTGWISQQETEKQIVATILKLIDSGELERTATNRLRVTKK
ncbi:hypothetical protein C5B42_05390 [Candidatus Cerribacteria bacterium 'Amazon FNV 2010 28 9']|uniref:Uncharacterized protein n=1 Tax=Candidatus Cerribacteria bacterium 'Amazon FNV 2010 28 9' TaxID=2081795 RepID=A0A317JS90_9BACT|nr:MAG: hypothetical protein C5B42_05390 [Candidatus Cerribacteria bacterium 'Amazon FNV 2010 28 9']